MAQGIHLGAVEVSARGKDQLERTPTVERPTRAAARATSDPSDPAAEPRADRWQCVLARTFDRNFLSGRRDLNPRPQRPERCALPSCATSRKPPAYFSAG